MLEQRRAQEKGYITLKEAATIANYSPDYVGQLIRAGKISGTQVYNNVAWVTTEDEIRSYLKNKGRAAAVSQEVTSAFWHPFFKFLLYTIITATAVLLLLLQYVLYVSIDTKLNEFFVAQASDSRNDF